MISVYPYPFFFFFYSRDQYTRKGRKLIHTHVGLWKFQDREMNNNVSKLKIK